MSSTDYAHNLTDKELAALEHRITRVYREAKDELNDTIKDYFESFKKRDEEMKKLIGTEMNGKVWTEDDYKHWRLNQIGRGERYQDLREKIAQRMTEANQTAIAYVNDATPGIYALNRNYAAYTIEKVSGNVGFTLWDEATVRRLITEEPDLMPYYPKKKAINRGIDLKWGKKQITKSVTSGLLQGNSVGKIATDLQARVTEMNRASAVRAARTAVTGAQNGGRMDSYLSARRRGIEIQKEWVATLDGRTRHSHRRLDGEVVDYDAEFSNGCRYPGDPRGKPAETYSCRCTLVARVKGVDTSDTQRRTRNPETEQSELIPNMTYTEWKGWVQKRKYGDIIGARTSNGIEIKMISAHSIDRGNTRSVTSKEMVDALSNPINICEIITDELGRKSQRFIGKTATVNINPDTGNITTVWRTGKRERRKYGGENDVFSKTD